MSLNNSQIGLVAIFFSYVVIMAGGCCQKEGFIGSITGLPGQLSQIPIMELLPFLILALVLYIAGVQMLGVQDCTAGIFQATNTATSYVTDFANGDRQPMDESGENTSEPFMKTNNAQLEGVLQAAVPLS